MSEPDNFPSAAAAVISTERLDLIPLTKEFLQASLSAEPGAAQRLAAFKVPPDWPDCMHVIHLRLAQLEEDPALLPWLLRAIVLRATGEMAGYAGFHTVPAPEYLKDIAPGAVELGFSIFPVFQRRGFAREAAQGLMRWATREHKVPEFILSIQPDNAPSQALAAQLGFRRIGSHVDEIDGVEDILYRAAQD